MTDEEIEAFLAADEELDDPLVEATLDRALAPYADLLPPDVLAVFRENARDFATTHPVMARLLDELRANQVSGPRVKAGARDSDAELDTGTEGSKK